MRIRHAIADSAVEQELPRRNVRSLVQRLAEWRGLRVHPAWVGTKPGPSAVRKQRVDIAYRVRRRASALRTVVTLDETMKLEEMNRP